MKYWIYVQPAGSSSHPVYTIMSQKAVLSEYYPYWERRMVESYGANSPLITEDNCIQDWVTLHWAAEATPEALLKILEDG